MLLWAGVIGASVCKKIEDADEERWSLHGQPDRGGAALLGNGRERAGGPIVPKFVPAPVPLIFDP